MKIKLISAFQGEQKHGGVRRSEQLHGVFHNTADWTPPLLSIKVIDIIKCLKKPCFFMMELIRFSNLQLSIKERVQRAVSIYYYRFIHTDWQSGGMVVIEYSAAYSRYAIDVANSLGIKYNLALQNIEFLVPGRLNSKSYSCKLTHELQAISKADSCVCISDFDASICEIYNPNVYTFPYYPNEIDKTIFSSIQTDRVTSTKNGYLILGTALNPPTRKGLIETVIFLTREKIQPAKINVIGYGTESLRTILAGKAIVHGGVSNVELHEHFKTTTLAVIYQQPTSGFLTRLVEMNLCGIPVVVLGGYRQAENLEKYGIFTSFEKAIAISPNEEYLQFQNPSFPKNSFFPDYE